MYRESLPEEVLYLLTYGETKIVFAEDEEQVDKLLELGDRAQSRREVLPHERRELRDPAVEQEALDAEHARVVQGTQLPGVARDGTAPEPDVDGALPCCRLALDLQGGHVDGGRQRVERHVHDRRDAARRRGAGGRGEALPLGAAGLVDVHVRVDEPGKEHLVVGEHHLADIGPAVDRGVVRQHGLDPLAVHEHRGGTFGTVDDGALCAQNDHTRSW